MSNKKKSTLGKDDLRRLMKAQRNVKSNIKSKKIISIHARYNSLDQLLCTLCNISIKSDLLWNAHISGRTHKQNIENKNNPPNLNIQRLNPAKRKNENILEHEVVPKQICSEAIQEDRIEENATDQSTSTLPTDFFDSGSRPTDEATKTSKVETKVEKKDVKPVENGASKSTSAAVVDANMSEAIPEGFFDDPVKDAKARKIEYRDKLDDEWEMFQKVIQEQSTVSENIMEDEEDYKTTERNIDEIDQQMHHWSKVEDLHQTRDRFTLTRKDIKEEIKTEEDVEDEDQEMDEFLDWRSKKAWK